jgi:hypothetical protein
MSPEVAFVPRRMVRRPDQPVGVDRPERAAVFLLTAEGLNIRPTSSQSDAVAMSPAASAARAVSCATCGAATPVRANSLSAASSGSLQAAPELSFAARSGTGLEAQQAGSCIEGRS